MPNNYPPNDFEYRRRSQRVTVDRPTGDVILRLHQTDIVRVRPNGDVILSTGGWATLKTLSSMNDALELFGMEVTHRGGFSAGNWTVTDSDGSVHDYTNDKTHYITTIRSKGADDRQRAQWLAEAYEVPYNPPAAPAAAAAAPSGPRIAAVSAAPPAAITNGVGGAGSGAFSSSAAAAAAAPAAVRPPGLGSSWANVAATRNQGTTACAPPRVDKTHKILGPSAASAAAAAHPGRVTGPGAAASAGPTRSGPPGFAATSNGNTPAAHQQHHNQQQHPAALQGQQAAGARQGGPLPASPAGAPATVMAAPPLPAAGAQLVAHMARLGFDQQEDEDDAHLCVVCMEEPRSIVLVPCGHMALCGNCCQRIIVQQKGTCPMCCQDVEYHVEVDS